MGTTEAAEPSATDETAKKYYSVDKVISSTLIHESASIATLLVTLVLSIAWTTGGNGAAPVVRCLSRLFPRLLRS